MNETNRREHARLMHRAHIRLTIPSLSQTHILQMRDFSEGGLYLLCADNIAPPLGSLVEIQTTEIDEAPIQKAKVIRTDAGMGFGVKFIYAET